MMKDNKQQAHLIKWFEELSLDDIPLVGGKNASLGEMYRRLIPMGIPVPNGFAITVNGYHQMIEKLGGWDKMTCPPKTVPVFKLETRLNWTTKEVKHAEKTLLTRRDHQTPTLS